MTGSVPLEAPRRAPAAPGGGTVAPRRLRGRRLLLTWTAAVTTAECLGFAAPAVTGAFTADLGDTRAIPLVLAAGAVEGAVLGWAQASVLRRALPRLRRGRWVLLTAVAAVAAYVLGFAASVAGSTLPGWAAAVAGLSAGSLLLLTLGGGQWFELRHHVPRAGRWVRWTALAWLVALGVFLVIATPLWHPGQPTGSVVAVGVGAGLVMAFVQAAVTGRALVRLVDDLEGNEPSGTEPSGTREPEGQRR